MIINMINLFFKLPVNNNRDFEINDIIFCIKDNSVNKKGDQILLTSDNLLFYKNNKSFYELLTEEKYNYGTY